MHPRLASQNYLIACKEEFRLQKSVSIAVLFIFSGAKMLVAQTMSDQDAKVHLNQIQVIGSHNSYNLGFAPSDAFAEDSDGRRHGAGG